jgi:phosphatidylinositol alpha 1,6-mannosyltransferase
MDGVKLVLVGGGPSEAELRRLLPDAAFLGVLHAEELGEAYASLDVFVHTGRHETFGQAVQEALAAGVPAVAPNQGGPVDVIDRGAGFLYTPGDGEDLKSYVEMLVANEPLRAQMGVTARRSVENRSWHAVNEILVGHYRAVVAERRGTSLRRAS